MQYFKNFLFLIAFLSLVGHAQEDLPTELKQRKFSPFMIDHEFKGCPENSHCSKDMGAKRQQWLDLLQGLSRKAGSEVTRKVEAFRKMNGIPISLWGFPPSLKNKEIISWNSSCPHHNLEKDEVYSAQMMIKSFNDLEEVDLNQKSFIESIEVSPSLIWLQTKTGEIIEYRIPRGSLPLQVVNDKLYFVLEDKGVYFGLLVDKNGDYTVTSLQKNQASPKEVNCPKELKDEFKRWPLSSRLYQDFFCRGVWDQQRKTYQVFLVGWSCP